MFRACRRYRDDQRFGLECGCNGVFLRQYLNEYAKSFVVHLGGACDGGIVAEDGMRLCRFVDLRKSQLQRVGDTRNGDD